MFKKDYGYYFKKAAETAPTNLSKCSNSLGTYSFGIVNSKRNGKRITLSKSLSTALGLEDTIELIAIPEEGILMVSKAFPEGAAKQYTLKGDPDGPKTCYYTEVVKALVKDFELDFDGHTSRSFNKITIDKSVDVPVAIVTLSSPIPTKSGERA